MSSVATLPIQPGALVCGRFAVDEVLGRQSRRARLRGRGERPVRPCAWSGDSAAVAQFDDRLAVTLR